MYVSIISSVLNEHTSETNGIDKTNKKEIRKITSIITIMSQSVLCFSDVSVIFLEIVLE